MMLLDTNIIIAYLKNDPLVTEFVHQRAMKNEKFCISSITITELIAFPKLNLQDRTAIETWIRDAVFVVAIDPELSFKAGDLCRELHLTTADGLIAATALHMGIPCVTRDKEFRRIAELQVIVP